MRGFETFGGRIAGVITEKGRVACRAVLLAGGAWSWLLLQQQGTAFPQPAVFSSNQRIFARSAPPVSPMASLRSRGFSPGFQDGTLGVPAGEPAIHDIIPASLRLLPDFLPFSGASRRHLGLRLGPSLPRRAALGAALEAGQARAAGGGPRPGSAALPPA